VLEFDGESRWSATLNRGPTTDFNVMTRRDRCYHQFGRRRLAGKSEFAARGRPDRCCSWPRATACRSAAIPSASAWCATTRCVRSGHVWSIEARAGGHLHCRHFLFNEEEEYEDECATARSTQLFTNVHLATMVDGYGEMRDAAIAVHHGRIAWLGAPRSAACRRRP
jgi:hypothetical protein